MGSDGENAGGKDVFASAKGSVVIGRENGRKKRHRISIRRLWYSTLVYAIVVGLSIVLFDSNKLQSIKDSFKQYTTNNNSSNVKDNNTINVTNSNVKSTKDIREQPEQDEQHQHPLNTPAIAWLMSFPRSGTSYTMKMTSQSSNRSWATNYGMEVIKKADYQFSVDPSSQSGAEGPYWPGITSGMSMGIVKGKKLTMRLPEKFVITKTHCTHSRPNAYFQTTSQFLQDCATSHYIQTIPSQYFGERKVVKLLYSPEKVQKVIHLFRNPMHNIISRFHQERLPYKQKQHNQNSTSTWLEDFPNTPEGFHKWCVRIDKTIFRTQDIKYFGGSNDEANTKIPSNIPCHGEFMMWTKWHNLADESIELMRNGGPSSSSGSRGQPTRDIPLLKVFYEDYNTKFDNITQKSILDFLELEQIYPFPEFRSKDYYEYFSETELIDIQSLVQSVATNNTWNDVQHYFVAETNKIGGSE